MEEEEARTKPARPSARPRGVSLPAKERSGRLEATLRGLPEAGGARRARAQGRGPGQFCDFVLFGFWRAGGTPGGCSGSGGGGAEDMGDSLSLYINIYHTYTHKHVWWWW